MSHESPLAALRVDRLARAVRVTYDGSLIMWALTGEGTLAETILADLDTLLMPYQEEVTK